MSPEEYKQFLEYVFNEYIRTRIHRIRHRHFEGLFHHRYCCPMQMAEEASHLLRFIDTHCEHSDDIYEAFTLRRLARLAEEVQNTLKFNNDVARDSGFADALDAHFPEIVDGIMAEYMPEAEQEILSQLGSTNPKADIQGMVSVVKSHKELWARRSNDMRFSGQLEHIEERIGRAEKEFREAANAKEPPKEKKSHRWFKGLGHILQGAVLSIADIGLAAGCWTFPVSPETQTWGTLVSATTGVGMVLIGAGEWKGE